MIIPPYGGELVDLFVPRERHAELCARATGLPSLQISERGVCDLSLLACGAFSPLNRFVGQEDYQHILDEIRLANGHLFPVPVTLPVERRADIRLDRDIALRNARNELVATMTVEDI